MNLKKTYEQIKTDIIRYGEDKKVVMKIQELPDESILYQYEYRDDCDKYILPRKEDDGWTWNTVSLSYLEMCVKYELADRKSQFSLV